MGAVIEEVTLIGFPPKLMLGLTVDVVGAVTVDDTLTALVAVLPVPKFPVIVPGMATVGIGLFLAVILGGARHAGIPITGCCKSPVYKRLLVPSECRLCVTTVSCPGWVDIGAVVTG